MTKIIKGIEKHHNILTIVLSGIGIGLIAYYDYCGSVCSYLKGDILGIDLKWIGIAFMAAIIFFAIFKQDFWIRAFLSTGLGVEVYLYAFQIRNEVCCPFCLAFSIIILLSFIINYKVPSAWYHKRSRMWLYFLGEVDFPMFKIQKLPLLLFSLLGYLTILLTFSGSVIPAYGQESNHRVPTFGKGDYEIIMFTDYFCTPCRRIDIKAEHLLKELLSSNKVKVTFIDVPFNKTTPLYAKYYLYAVNADSETDGVFKIRKVLFDAAQGKNIHNEDQLIDYLKKQNISWKKMGEKVVFPMLNAAIIENNINATPTCVIRHSAADIKKFVGDTNIWKGLTELKSQLIKN
ncbi:MAG: hypothetical protein APR62_06400 [Smithella sp. SDB]|nr:MAG: hypothetical protein APR62_06400 [Smithella sp. SDB]